MKYSLLFCIAVVVLFALPVSASENIRVAIADDQRVVSIKSSSDLLIAGSPSGGHQKLLRFTPASVGGKPVRIRSIDAFTQVNGKRYRGWLELRKKKNGLLLVVNDLDLEEYLGGVIAAEIPPDWEFEALKAQAVASRTYALYEKRTAGKKPYHILATIMSQVYNGANGEQINAVRAVKETRGLILTYRGELIPAFYHANCGGHTENASLMWGIDAPYLKGVDCECQNILKDEFWEKRVSVFHVSAALRRQGFRVDDITAMSIAGITPAGRVMNVTIRSARGATTVPAEIIRAALGTTEIPSLFFELELSEGEAVFSGRGRGHGVGLCQWGAKEMAGKGHDFKSILSRYYPGTVMERMK
ncbi:MAG: SpoIID/LytB domain-containing protein [Nitrospirae bacterium]|nr:SpoIID/LytB domain-containing protein [Nitrospirota bacterium]